MTKKPTSANDNEVPQDISTVDGEPTYFEFSATLRIFGQIDDFDAITRELDVTPTRTHRRGDKAGPRSPGFKHDMWSYKAPVPEERSLDEHINALWMRLRPHKDYLLRLKETLTVDVFCGYRTNHWGSGFEVRPESLEMFTALQIPFGVSVIVA
jgi:hypothetical protein